MSHDVIYQKIKRNKFFYINPFNILLFLTEKIILNSANLILTFSHKDKDLIKNNYHLNSEVVSFFIDKKIKEINYNEILISRKFCFYGAWNRPENREGLIWFINEVLPYVDNEIKFEIIGPGIDASLLNRIKVNDQIQYLGFLDNPYLKIAESQALIAPIFNGAGVKVKVIESLATGTPIIGTEIAFEGINDLGLNSMISCSKAEDFINNINNFQKENFSDKVEIKLLFERSYAKNTIKNILNAQSVC
jgi:glycosyltransferase involved in cell wall biosynthesis